MAHFYTWPAAMYRALCEATARTSESPGRLRRCAPYKGLPPLAPLRGYPCPCGELNIVPFDRFTSVGKAVFLFTKFKIEGGPHDEKITKRTAKRTR